MIWDAFLSHASEDKQLLVRPIADRLESLGLSVAFDEYTFRIGDSLVDSIDRGIANSSAGVLFLSQSFLGKGWPEHERRGLMARMVAQDHPIIPVWYDVDASDLMERFPTLADRIAIVVAGKSLDEVARLIAVRVRPDLFSPESAIKKFVSMVESADGPKNIPIEDLQHGPIVHESLPNHLVKRIRMIHAALAGVQDTDLDQLLDLYQRELIPELELRFWEHLAAILTEATVHLAPADPQRGAVYNGLFSGMMGGGTMEFSSALDEETTSRLASTFRFVAPWERG